MSAAWETTTGDVQTVLTAHGVEVSAERLAEIHGGLDHEDIEEGVLLHTNMEAQTDSMLSDIEDELMKNGVIPNGDKKFIMADEYEDDGDIEDDDDDF